MNALLIHIAVYIAGLPNWIQKRAPIIKFKLSVMLAVCIVCRIELLSILAAAFSICVYTALAKRSLEHVIALKDSNGHETG